MNKIFLLTLFCASFVSNFAKKCNRKREFSYNNQCFAKCQCRLPYIPNAQVGDLCCPKCKPSCASNENSNLICTKIGRINQCAYFQKTLKPVGSITLSPTIFSSTQCPKIINVTEPSSTISIKDINLIVQKHNNARLDVFPFAENMKMISWNPELAKLCETFTITCNGKHSVFIQRYRVANFTYIGENMAFGFEKWEDVIDDGWMKEKEFFTYPFTCAPLKNCLHYTEMIWAKTTDIGCAVYPCGSRGPQYRCLYGEGGNIINEKPYIESQFKKPCLQSNL